MSDAASQSTSFLGQIPSWIAALAALLSAILSSFAFFRPRKKQITDLTNRIRDIELDHYRLSRNQGSLMGHVMMGVTESHKAILENSIDSVSFIKELQK